MLGGSWKCNYAFYWETFLFVCLVECICFLLFGRFCLLKWDFPFVFIPTVTKNRIPRTAEVALFYLLRWSVWRLVRGIQREAQALMKLYCGHGNKPPTPEVERYRGASLHFFHPETRQTWPSFWNVFQTFYNCRNTFFPLTGQVSAVYFKMKVEISWRKEHRRSLSPSTRWRLNTKPGKPSHVCDHLALRQVFVGFTWMDLVSPVCLKPFLKAK